ncbi:MAG: 3-methyl-2-oxobutanoate hydroxymethyltransferase [bacterium]
MIPRNTVEDIRRWPKGKLLLALTAYDYPMARVLDEAGVDILHVGDSLGMVVLGFPDTTSVTMDDILRSVGAVARARQRALLTADLPLGSYDTPERAVANARVLTQAGADAVKVEGGREILPQIQALRKAGIEVEGHLGMLPQHVREEGGYKRKGKTAEEISKLKDDAQAIVEAGVFSVVLEVVVPEIAEELTQMLPVPTLGIASGLKTTGQIRVTHDILGLCPWFAPAHAKPVVRLSEQITQAINDLKQQLSASFGRL